MNPPARLFMDVSYTRTQHVNVGITRTVRRLEEELRRLYAEGEGDFAAVSYHRGGFRSLRGGVLPPATPPGHSSAPDPGGSRLFRWIAGPFFRKVVLSALLLPWPLLRFVWSTTSSWAFNFLSRAEQPVKFSKGDMLLLSDASWNYPVWLAARKARAEGACIVLIVYDLMPFQHPEFCFPLVPPIFRLWLERMLPLANCVLCISAATETDLRAHARSVSMLLPPTGHFHLGSDPARVLGPSTGVRPQLLEFLDAGTPCFAAIGSFEPKKNYGFLLEVFERLWSRAVAVRLLIIGRATPECDDLVRRVREHPQQGSNLLTLFDATDGEVAAAYRDCRALVFTSMAEGFGLPLVEARTRGSLVIASDLPAFVELADQGVSIYRQGSHTALEELLTRAAAKDRRAETPPMRAFSWQDSATQLLATAQQLSRTQEAN